MPLADRMKLAEGKPLPRRLMAAMAQQDCGQCGYNCKDYSDAMFAKTEERLNLCVPGGKETARMLKQLYHRARSAAGGAGDGRGTGTGQPAGARPSRDNPVVATLARAAASTSHGSEKETWHIEFDLSGSDLDYVVGDCFGIFPVNDSDLVDAVIAALDAPPDFPIGGRTLREALTDGVSLSPAPDMLFQLISYLTGGERSRRRSARRGAGSRWRRRHPRRARSLAEVRGHRPDPEAFIEALDPLQPRVYSISSSPNRSGSRLAYGRCGALRSRRPHAARRRLDLPRRPHRGRAAVQRLCAEGAAFCAARRSEQTGHHDWAWHRHRAVPRIPAGAPGHKAPGPNWLSSAISAATTISSTKKSSAMR